MEVTLCWIGIIGFILLINQVEKAKPMDIEVVKKYRGFTIEERFNRYYITGLPGEFYSVEEAKDFIDHWLDEYDEDI